jgi:glutamyl-tRNA synthetase
MTTHLRAVPPPGAMHVAAARLALSNWRFAREGGGRFTLRLEEDAGEAEAELRWLGLDWDAVIRPADRAGRLHDAAETLKAAGRLYPCFESEEELQVKRDLRARRGQPAVYDRAMLKLTAAQREAAEAGGKRPYWRFRLSDGEANWPDRVLGRQRIKLPSLSDPILLRPDGAIHPLFAAAVDDIAEEISHVIACADQLAVTAMQIDLLAALGRNPGAIAYSHLPVLRDADDPKSPRRFDGPILRALRQDGVEPRALVALLERPSATFDGQALLSLNREVLAETAFAVIAPRLPPGATEAFWLAVRGDIDLLGEARGLWDVVTGAIVPPVIEGQADFLRTALEMLPPEPWDLSIWPRWLEALQQATGRRGPALQTPLRLALTGEDEGPDLEGLLPLIGRTRAVQRLQTAAT